MHRQRSEQAPALASKSIWSINNYQNDANIDPAATERVFRMGAVTRMAIDVFEHETSAIAWMRQPNSALGNAAPLDLMDTEPGANSVREVLNAIATGGAA